MILVVEGLGLLGVEASWAWFVAAVSDVDVDDVEGSMP
jgi:uncharacterized protein YjeT (DUF2065 family)